MMTPEAAAREFFEKASLYQKRLVPTADGRFVAPETITLPCDECAELEHTTWRRCAMHICMNVSPNGTLPALPGANTSVSPLGYPTGTRPDPPPKPAPRVGTHYAFACGRCGKRIVQFWIASQDRESGLHAEVRKLGQWPAWSIQPPRAIRDALDAAHLDLYKKARACVSQSYGIAAFAYLRQIIEGTTSLFLDLIEEDAKEQGDDALVAKVGEARKNQQATEKLKIAGDILPASLRPGGINPLAQLYGDLSEGLHARTDDDCIAISARLLTVFDYVFENIKRQIDAGRVYRAAVKRT